MSPRAPPGCSAPGTASTASWPPKGSARSPAPPDPGTRCAGGTRRDHRLAAAIRHAADRDTTTGQLITAIVFLSEATLSLAGNAPRHRTIDLYAVGAGLAEARVALATAIQIPASQATRHRSQAAASDPGDRE